jgi:hypothetical protein
MSRAYRPALIAVWFIAVFSGQVAAEPPSVRADGWHTWQVDEATSSKEMCCFTWGRGEGTRQGCDLDGRKMSFTDGGDCVAPAGKLQVYTRIDDGRPIEIRVLSSNCPVSAASEILDLGLVSADDNLTWFRRIIEDKSLLQETREQALFALVMSESEAAYTYLDRLLLSHQ